MSKAIYKITYDYDGIICYEFYYSYNVEDICNKIRYEILSIKKICDVKDIKGGI